MTNESADDLRTLAVCSDDALWAAAESSLSPTQQRRLEQLSAVADTRSLTAAESSELTHLMEQYDRSVLRRAKALSILAQRGHSIPDQAAFNGGSDDGSIRARQATEGENPS